MVFEIYREQLRPWRTGRWQWRLKADSEQTIAFGQGYASRKQAEQAVAMVKDACSAEVPLILAKKQHH